MIYENLAAYYDQFIDDKLNQLYVKTISKYVKSGTVIDMGTGTGPLAILLSKKGYNVTGTDIIPQMLEVAYNNAINADANIRFYLHDILDPLNSFYDVITMVSDVVNYIEEKSDIQKVFRNIKDSMHKKSILVFDFITVKHVEKMDKYHEDLLMHDDLIEWNVSKTIIPNQIKHHIKIGKTSETHIQTTYKATEYTEMLKKSGLTVVERIKYNERLILVCKKSNQK